MQFEEVINDTQTSITNVQQLRQDWLVWFTDDSKMNAGVYRSNNVQIQANSLRKRATINASKEVLKVQKSITYQIIRQH